MINVRELPDNFFFHCRRILNRWVDRTSSVRMNYTLTVCLDDEPDVDTYSWQRKVVMTSTELDYMVNNNSVFSIYLKGNSSNPEISYDSITFAVPTQKNLSQYVSVHLPKKYEPTIEWEKRYISTFIDFSADEDCSWSSSTIKQFKKTYGEEFFFQKSTIFDCIEYEDVVRFLELCKELDGLSFHPGCVIIVGSDFKPQHLEDIVGAF